MLLRLLLVLPLCIIHILHDMECTTLWLLLLWQLLL